jgi:hypothetical protein
MAALAQDGVGGGGDEHVQRDGVDRRRVARLVAKHEPVEIDGAGGVDA